MTLINLLLTGLLYLFKVYSIVSIHFKNILESSYYYVLMPDTLNFEFNNLALNGGNWFLADFH